jgi:hypothetical protein
VRDWENDTAVEFQTKDERHLFQKEDDSRRDLDLGFGRLVKGAAERNCHLEDS